MAYIPKYENKKPLTAAQTNAMKLVDEFAASGKGGCWKGINTADVIESLRDRIENPEHINQADAMLCAAAAYVYQIAVDRPELYAKMVLDLYHFGETVFPGPPFRGGTYASASLRNTDSSNFSINPVDWMMLASVRNDDNYLLPFWSTGGIYYASAMTLPSTMRSWLSRVGYTNIIGDPNVFFTKDLTDAKRASDYFSRGWKVFLFVNSYMLEPDEEDKHSTFPNHWIVLRSSIQTNSGGCGAPGSSGFENMFWANNGLVTFDAYSWGEINHVGAPSNKRRNAFGGLTQTDFCANYYGFLAATL